MSRIRLGNAEFVFLNQGAIIHRITVAGHDVVLSLPTAQQYLNAPYFGETIGRVANRIQDGRIHNLNGRAYQLSKNERNVNHHHGGQDGWGHKQFSGPGSITRSGRDALLFIHTSPDGDEGYPGTVELRVYYMVYEVLEQGIVQNVLEIEYEAELIGDECEETVINVTNHSYFNIGDKPTIEGTQLTLNSLDYLQTNDNGIPTGNILRWNVGDKSPASKDEASKHLVLGAEEPRIDHCFVNGGRLARPALDTRGHEAKMLARAVHPHTKIHLEVCSTEPSFQLYTGDFINIPESSDTPARGPRSGFCIEPGRCINAVNMPEWRHQVILARGQQYGSRILYKLWKD